MLSHFVLHFLIPKSHPLTPLTPLTHLSHTLTHSSHTLLTPLTPLTHPSHTPLTPLSHTSHTPSHTPHTPHTPLTHPDTLLSHPSHTSHTPHTPLTHPRTPLSHPSHTPLTPLSHTPDTPHTLLTPPHSPGAIGSDPATGGIDLHYTIILLIFICFSFYVAHWEKYSTGILYLPWMFDIAQLVSTYWGLAGSRGDVHVLQYNITCIVLVPCSTLYSKFYYIPRGDQVA